MSLPRTILALSALLLFTSLAPAEAPQKLLLIGQGLDGQHPATTHEYLAGVGKFRVKDEFYYELKFAKPEGSVKPLLRVPIDGKDQVVAWAWERPDGGRSFGFSGLHFHDNWKLAEYRRLVAQGVVWTLKLPVPKDGLAAEVTEAELKLK